MSAAELDQLAVLLDALRTSAVDFRRRGRTCCAVETEQIAMKLHRAINKEASAA